MAESDVKGEEKQIVEATRRRQQQLEVIRQPWEGDWQEISELVQPRREALHFAGTKDKGARSSTKRFDGTPTKALQLLADGLMGYLVSPSLQWFKLKVADDKLNDIPAVRQWLQDTEKQLYAEFLRSNFYEEMHAYFLDGGSFGTASIYCEEDIAQGRLVFNTRHMREIYIAEDRYGMVDTVHRKFDLAGREVVKAFGEDKLDENVLKMAEDKPDEEFEILHSVFPNSDRMYNNLASWNKKYTSLYVFNKGVGNMDTILRRSGYDENPYAIWRWRKNSTEVYGRSPAHDALVDIKALNDITRDLLNASQMAVNPPYNIPDEQAFDVKLTPAGHNFYSDPSRIISAINTNMNFPVGKDERDDYRQIIRKHFRVEFFLMLAEAERQMTATEIVERQGEKSAVLGATIGRLNTECMNPIIDRVYRIAFGAGRIPEPPEVLREYGAEIEVDYIGPLAQAQKRLFKTQGVMRSLEAIDGVAGMMPTVIDIFDPDEIGREIAESFGMPVKAIRDPKVVAEIRAARQKAIDEERKMAQMAEMAKAVPSLQGASEEGSPMDQLAQQ